MGQGTEGGEGQAGSPHRRQTPDLSALPQIQLPPFLARYRPLSLRVLKAPLTVQPGPFPELYFILDKSCARLYTRHSDGVIKMGYTHYWRRPAAIPQETMRAIVDDFGRFVRPLDDAGVRLCGGNGEDAAQITPDVVSFNGLSGRANEAFHFPRVMQPPAWRQPADGLYSAFCKTALQPYDLAVMAFLLVAKHYLPQIQIATDGEDEQWNRARDFCHDVLGYGREYKVDLERRLEISSSRSA